MSRNRLTVGVKVRSLDTPSGESSNDAWWGTFDGHIKIQEPAHPLMVANEFVCARLANALGILTPFGDVSTLPDNRLSWSSAVVQLPGGTPAPEEPDDLVAREPSLCAGILVFDVWVCNYDRHEKNVISHPRLGIYVIDHDQALMGQTTSGTSGLKGMKSRTSWHMFQDSNLNPGDLHSWGVRVQQITKTAIRGIVTEADRRGLLNPGNPDDIEDFLLHRQQEIHRLVKHTVQSDVVAPSLGEDQEEAERGEE